MPFGKHKGKELKDVPRSYLHWVWENLDIKHDELNECLESLFGDGDEVEAEVEDNEPCGNGKVIDIEKISKIWLVKMSNKYHPDRKEIPIFDMPLYTFAKDIDGDVWYRTVEGAMCIHGETAKDMGSHIWSDQELEDHQITAWPDPTVKAKFQEYFK